MPKTVITIYWQDTQGQDHTWMATEQADGETFVYHEQMERLPITNGTMNEDELEPAISAILEKTVQ